MTRPCGRPVPQHYSGCAYPRLKGKQRCVWHWLVAQSSDIQTTARNRRLAEAFDAAGGSTEGFRGRVPQAEWPEDERWCAGCQSFVPLFYCSGSRCKACTSKAAHESRVQKVYDLAPGEYDGLFELQGGRCFICQRQTQKRLAVDHDHDTGRVRGLLCASDEHGCNRAVLGNIKDIHAARRILLYLAVTPYDRLHGAPAIGWEDYVRSEAARLQRMALGRPRPVVVDPAPF